MGKETFEELLAHVRTSSNPSDLKITDIKVCDVGRPYGTAVFKILTNQGLEGYGQVREGCSRIWAVMLKRLLIGEESALWFRDKKVKCVGFGDGVSIENCNEDVKPFHDILMAENITFLEVLKNLDQLKSDTFFMSYSPLPITGLDSCPVRVYAIEGIAQFS